MMMIMRSTLNLGKTCLTESARLLPWLGIDQTFHCYSLFSNHSAVTQDTVLLLCFLRVFPFLFPSFSFPILCLLPRMFSVYLCIILNIVWFGKKSSLQKTCCFLLVVLAISGYFLYKGRQQRKSGSRFCSASAFVDP